MTASLIENEEATTHHEATPLQKIAPSDQKDLDSLRTSIQAAIDKTDFWTKWQEEHGPEISLDECKQTLKKLLVDDANMLRILIARKRDIAVSTKLFFEQVKWRAKWQPETIDTGSIPTALKCEFFASYFSTLFPDVIF